jgi:hypothetical protein
MVNFTNNTFDLTTDVSRIIEILGYKPKLYKSSQKSIYPKYTVRLSREVDKFLQEIQFQKH